ncbi:MAG: DUF1549 and DUF1553 domain-containing protein [Planctomycetota bacterium]|nr:DUF1549 and DUF1553 domain-containing protein [Planctomycetota bacterium]
MNFSDQRKGLTVQQIQTLERWIAEGAVWGRHWAFEPVTRPQLPPDAPHPVDAFVVSRLKAEGLTLSPPAPRHTLARRTSFDITGLPPTFEEITRFEQDDSPDAWEQWVDRLLASEHFGERMAMWWLDAARYADTDGYQRDDTRTNWPWRDWVIGAFNRNLPFDQFTIEQFAGDLLEGATDEQRLATSFHRNHMTNGEGGRDPEESRIEYVIDRVNTVGTVWLGLTLGCCQCHSHKFDPIAQRDYYSLTAFFNSIDEDGSAGRSAKPYLAYTSPHVAPARREAESLVAARKTRVDAAMKNGNRRFETWLFIRTELTKEPFQPWHLVVGARLEATEGTVLTQEVDGTVVASGPNPRQDDYRVVAPVTLDRVTGIRLEVFPHESHTKGAYSRGAEGHFLLTDVKAQVRRKGDTQVRDLVIASAVADHSDDPAKHEGYGNIVHVLDDDPRNGWSTRDETEVKRHVAVFALATPLKLAADEELVFELRQRSTLGDANLARFRVSVTNQRGPAVLTVGEMPLERLWKLPAEGVEAIPDDLREQLREQYFADDAPVVAARESLARAKRQLDEVVAAEKVEVMVLAERAEPRETHLLVRGQWDKKGDKVTCDVPPAVAPWPADLPRSRLGLARWLVSRDNPLAARVFVNHVWQILFGSGLVRTPEDFGLQGERPTHPELLDWLAADFMENGWNIKRLIRQIVTSQTYQQSSRATAELLARDPQNRLLARGARYRLPSWMLRDSALRSAGLLVTTVGGPPVRPWQPDGVWEENFMGRFHYEPSDGPAQYRRSLYAFWRRAIAPTFLFDTAQRRVCEVRLSRTNTPLQALTLLNDVNYLNASYAIAVRAVRTSREPADRVREIFRTVLGRVPAEREVRVLLRESEKARQQFEQSPDETRAFLRGVSWNLEDGAPDLVVRLETDIERADLASAVLTASLILNLDEAISHE